MKIKLALLTLTLLSGHFASSASAVVAAPGFPDALPNAANGVNYVETVDGVEVKHLHPNGAQLAGLGAYSSRFQGITGAPGTAFVAWEKFATGTFNGLAAQYYNAGGGLTGTLSQLAQVGSNPGVSSTASNPGLVNVGGVDYFGRLTSGPYDFSISATSLIDAGRVVLGIKHSPFFDVDYNAITAFSPTLNGVEAQSLYKTANFGNYADASPATGMFGNATVHYYFYTWDLDIESGDPLVLNFASGADALGFGFSVDAIALSVQPIPEPSSMALLAVGMAGAMYLKRRRQRA